MPYDHGLAERLEDIFSGCSGFQQKKMFGGIGWMLTNKYSILNKWQW